LRQPQLFDLEEEGPLFFEEQALERGYQAVAGVDEAGRGPLAGPVVAAAVILPPGIELPEGIDDSKKLSPSRRQALLSAIQSHPQISWGVGIVEAVEIDSLNILNATHLAMKKAVEQLDHVDFCLVDGLPVKGLPVEHLAIVKGDSRSRSIAAASIIAKESRDAMMVEYSEKFPEYSFEMHKGYGTKVHLEALRDHGPCEIHRRSFAPVRNSLREE